MTNTLSRQSRTEARRKAILQAALTSFLTRGFTDTTIEHISQLSGASIGSIYHHFENKEMLALALYKEGYEDQLKQLLASTHHLPAREGVKALVRTYLDWFERHPDFGQFIFQAGATEYLGELVTALRQTTSLLAQNLLDWLHPFIADGSIISYPPSIYVPLLLGPSREFVRCWLRGGTPEELREARETLAETAWLVLDAGRVGSVPNAQPYPAE